MASTFTANVSTISLPALVEPAGELTSDEVERYSRHLIIPEIGVLGQRRLKNAKVLVIGAGGLGSPALLYLAAAGVGTLGIAEFDTVDESNLQRQVIHGVSDIDKAKGVSAKESIAEINPYVEVILHPDRLDNDNVLDVFKGYDLIVDGTDNFATRYMVNEAIKLLTGIGDPIAGKLMIYDALEMEYRKLKVRKDPNCALCGDNATVTELIDYDAFCGAISEEAADAAADATISVIQLEQMLKERENGERDFVLVDVREPNEYEINRIPGSVPIPKGDFLNGSALSELPSDKQIVLHCKSGVRSAEALAVVKGAGFSDAVHVGGGVVAWVNQIDPSQPTY